MSSWCRSISLREHELSCRHAARDPVQLNLNGPLKGKGFYVKRIVDSAGGPANRSYKVDWSHPLDPSPGLMPGDEDYIHWEFDPVVHPPGHAAT